MDPIQPIARSDRSVQPVDLTRLSPLEREREKQRRERERQRRQAAPQATQKRGSEPDSGLDVRV